MKKKFVLGVLCVSMILAAGIGVSAEVSENHSQWAEESLISADEAGLLPNFFSDRDLTANISRIDFCHLAYKMLEQKSLISENNVKSSFADTDDAFLLKYPFTLSPLSNFFSNNLIKSHNSFENSSFIFLISSRE